MSNTLDHFDIPTNIKDRNTNFKAKLQTLLFCDIRQPKDNFQLCNTSKGKTKSFNNNNFMDRITVDFTF
jgi:hypothetical protein